ncbi:MAG TPA: CusA/CzcA family heavy metal efflux RND transporter [Chitinophagaceae bacterium]|nr:CusA/CzcA family heavy metal efflux RND transporter [Chitinophagaceae bacterium]
MLNAIIRFSVRNKLIVGLCTLALMIWGGIELKRLPIDALPDITSNQVQIITVSPSLAAPEVERLITFPLEQATASVPGIEEMRSISRFGLSVVTIVFNDETDIYWARQQVGERLSLAKEQIPPQAGTPELAPLTTGIGEIYQYVLRPAEGYEGKYDLTELRSIQDWIVRRQLLGTPGVADVSSFGGYLKQYEVAVLPDHLKSMKVAIADVFTALEKNNQNSGGAYIEKGPNALFIRTEGLATGNEEIEQIVVRYTENGMPVRIADVATVRTGHAIRYGAMTYKDQGEVAGAVVLMLKGANASRVVEQVKDKIEEIKKGLPEGVILETFYDRTKMVDRAISTVKKNLAEGALIVVFVLVLFLGNFRAGLIVASVIPLSMLFAVIMMNHFGVSGNLMSLGALDFGLIVDGAVIIVEAVLHRLAYTKLLEGQLLLTRNQLNSEVESAAGKMMNTAVFGQIIILIVYLPILTLTGIEGKMFKPMAQTVAFALTGAFLLSLTYVPMMSSLFLSRKVKRRRSLSDRMMEFFQKKYRPVLQAALRFPRVVTGVSLVLFAIAVLLMSRLGGEFIPEMEEGDFAVDARLLTGSSLTETIAATQKAVAVLQAGFPEVEKIVTRIGASEIPTDPMPLEMTDIMITLKPKEQWVSASSFDELANKMSKAMEVVPGLTAGFQFPVQMRFNELISGARQDVVCKIFGEDLDSLAAFAARMGAIAGTVKGAKDIYIETVTGLPQIVIRYNREALAHYRISIEEVNRTIGAAYAGEKAGIIYENERRYDLVVRLDETARHSLGDVQNLLIATSTGAQVPLQQVAEVSIKEGPNQVQREDAQRRIIVGFNVRGRDVESVVKELGEKATKELRLPSGYFIRYGGQFENLTEAKERLFIAVPAALLLILVLLYFAFGSLKYGVLIFSAIPLSAIGGVLALWMRGMPFSISAGVGFIALFGVAVLNGIVLIAEFNRMKKQGINDIKKIVMEGASVRLRPVLMTASVASLGFLPMALSQGAGAEVQRPLATVVIGGLITATFLTLVVLPVLYTWLEKRRFGRGKKSIAAVIITVFLLPVMSEAQTGKSLPGMLEQAKLNNLSALAQQKEAGYWQQLGSNVFEAEKTQIGAEYGGISSAQHDTRFFLGQNFSMPVVYKRQKDWYRAEALAMEQMAAWRQAELNREVKLTFYQLVDGLERMKLLDRLDSVYNRLEQVAALRYKVEESSLLEKTSADAQVSQLKLQKQQLAADIRIAQRRLQWLLNTTENLLPEYDSPVMAGIVNTADTALLLLHPEPGYYRAKADAAMAQASAEKAKLTPDIGLQYSNQSIIGFQSRDGITQQYYGAGRRFHTAGVTLAIPLFNGAAKSRVKAIRISGEKERINAAASVLQLQQELLALMEEKNKHLQTIAYYEKTGKAQADLLVKNALLAFTAGEASYMEWLILMNNAVHIQLSYIDAVKAFNQATIKIEYLTGK